jgi:hypothetical protein
LSQTKFSTPQADVEPVLSVSPLYETSQRQAPSALATNEEFVVEYVSPLAATSTVTVCEYSGVPAHVASDGLKSLKVIVPPAVPVTPLSVAESLGMRLWAVEICELFWSTTTISVLQPLVVPTLLASPL